jgi:hypothetical protein
MALGWWGSFAASAHRQEDSNDVRELPTVSSERVASVARPTRERLLDREQQGVHGGRSSVVRAGDS